MNYLLAAKLGDGGDDPVTPPPITSDKMAQWNRLIDFAKNKGYAGKPELDHDPKLRQQVFDEYNKANPKDQITQDIVQPVQNEMQNYKQRALANIKSGGGLLQGSQDNFMPTISKVDGIFGQRTSSWKFPSAYIVDKATGEKKNVGFAPKVDMSKMVTQK